MRVCVCFSNYTFIWKVLGVCRESSHLLFTYYKAPSELEGHISSLSDRGETEVWQSWEMEKSVLKSMDTISKCRSFSTFSPLEGNQSKLHEVPYIVGAWWRQRLCYIETEAAISMSFVGPGVWSIYPWRPGLTGLSAVNIWVTFISLSKWI